jgi:hypothetical protein
MCRRNNVYRVHNRGNGMCAGGLRPQLLLHFHLPRGPRRLPRPAPAQVLSTAGGALGVCYTYFTVILIKQSTIPLIHSDLFTSYSYSRFTVSEQPTTCLPS